MSGLMNCPFCGDIPVSISRGIAGQPRWQHPDNDHCPISGYLLGGETFAAAWNCRTPDPAQIRADALRAAGQEYILEHVMETDWHRQGRHSAIRGMMVRMGLYAELEAAIDEAIAESAPPLSPTAVDGSPAPDAGTKGQDQ